MIIEKIKLDGYRNIIDTTIKFANITALIGINNYGKSNVLDCIDFAHKFINAPSNIKTMMMGSTSRLPINKVSANRDFLYEIEYLTSVDEKDYMVNYEFSFEWIKDNDQGSRIKHEQLKIKENLPGNKYTVYLKRDIEGCFYKSSPQGRVTTKLNVEANELTINKLMFYDDLYYLALIKQLNNIVFDFNEFYDVNGNFSEIPIELKIMENSCIEPFNGNLPGNISKAVYLLKDKYPDKYELLVNSFQTLVPSVEYIDVVSIDYKGDMKLINEEDVPFRIVDKIYRMRVKEKYNNQSIDFNRLSNGTKRIFIILASAIMAEINNVSLVTFEEPENCIHPSLFQQLLIILTGIIKQCRILVTSHSPYLIQYLELDRIYIGIPSQEGVAEFKRVKKSAYKSLYKHAEEENMSLGDYIFDMLLESYAGNSSLNSLLESD